MADGADGQAHQPPVAVLILDDVGVAGGLDGEGLLRAVLKDFDLEVLEKHPVEYRCCCSRERVSRALISMGREELSSLIEDQGRAELTCQFCDAVYRFSQTELEQLLAEM